MGSLLKIFVGLCLFSALAACSSKSDSQKAVDDANRSVEQAKKDADKAAEDAKKAAEDAANAGKKANESALDATSYGGQPGSVVLAGALVRDENTLDSRITVNLLAGKSWRGQRPEVNAGTLQLKVKISDSTVQEIEKLKDDKTFVNLGCDASVRGEVKDLEEKQIEASTSPLALIKAKVVLICDGKQIKSSMTLITAETVIIAGLRHEMNGAVDKSLSVSTNDLVVEGDNLIISKGKDGASTLLQGPSVSIAATKLSGNGKIEINAEGSSYQAEAK